MALTFSHGTKLINVPQIDAAPLTIQALINAIRTEEASERGIVESQIASAAGKDDLGGGVSVGVTVNLLLTWKLNFESGAYQATIDGGNLSDALARINNTGNPQVLVRASAAGTISTVVVSGANVITGDIADIATPADVADAVIAAAQVTPIRADARKMNGANVIGDGSVADPWRGEGVPAP